MLTYPYFQKRGVSIIAVSSPGRVLLFFKQQLSADVFLKIWVTDDIPLIGAVAAAEPIPIKRAQSNSRPRKRLESPLVVYQTTDKNSEKRSLRIRPPSEPGPSTSSAALNGGLVTTKVKAGSGKAKRKTSPIPEVEEDAQDDAFEVWFGFPLIE